MKKLTTLKFLLPFGLFLSLFLWTCQSEKGAGPDYQAWPIYRGDETGSAYSSLDEINTNNVNDLEVAWVFHTKDGEEGKRSTIQCNPILVDGLLYVTSPKLKVMALHPGTGHQVWCFDPFEEGKAAGVNRGVTFWENGDDKRILFAASHWLYALDAKSGEPIGSFGENGRVDLRDGLGRDPEKLFVNATTPGIIFEDLLILGSALGESYDAAPGHIRAYHVPTGGIAWIFHTIPRPGEFGYGTWEEGSHEKVGGVNNWAGMAIDRKRGWVFAPTGSAAFDFYGGNRKGENLFANCILALDARTGERKWHYQAVRHDLWDYDLPAQPNLVTVNYNGKDIEAVAQITKMGFVFLLDRETGKPLFEVEEVAVPPSTIPGEEAWPTQPIPVKPPPFSRTEFTLEELTNISEESNEFVLEKIKGMLYGNIFTPPSLEGTVMLPGTRGGGEWGGAAIDPRSGVMYVNGNEMAVLIKMKPLLDGQEGEALASKGARLYTLNNCTMCHGADRKGAGTFPSLEGLEDRFSKQGVKNLLQTGKGQMPAFPNLSAQELETLTGFLFDEEESAEMEMEQQDLKYVHDGWNLMVDQFGYPGLKPPWGTLNAIDLNKGEILWQVPLGEYPELSAKGVPPTGTHNIGGPIVTAGGLVFIGASKDSKFRAFDQNTGEILWEHTLPASGHATPSTYIFEGKQYVVIAAGGGGKPGSLSGDAFVAFALPGH